jgi:two-component system cell cycle sensor histidine kinase/response regulator CckA
MNRMPIEPITVLLIEDDPEDADLFREMLSERNADWYEVEWVDCLQAGLERLTVGPADLVILDLSLPDGQGLETFGRLHVQAPDVPIVVLSGLDDESLAVRAVQEGAQDYLVKGQVDGHGLARAMRYALERARAESALRKARDELEGRVRERTAELAEANAAMRQEIEQRRRLSAAIEQAAEGVIIADVQGRVLYVNPAFEQMTGYDGRQVVGQTMHFLSSDKQHPAVLNEMQATIHAGKVWHGQLVVKRKDNTLLTMELTVTPVRDEQGEIVNYVGLHRDVTRELQLEEQRRQSQRMEAVGLLAGGIAHDFNNLLTAITGFAGLAQLQLKPDHPARELVDMVLDSGWRAADLVHQLLIFSRRQVVEPETTDLNSIVTGTGKLLQRTIGEHVQMQISPAADLWPVKVDPTQFEQVIINLAVNARDAMPDGGVLTIETANVVFDEGQAATHLGPGPGEYVLLAVSDTGAGMSEEVRSHIFEPFFTTKALGQGTGLGLATVYSIVQQAGGHIEVFSQEGQGTVFKVYLPRAEQVAAPAPHAEPGDSPPRGTETVLLTEDEQAVRELAALALEKQGYRVLKAADGPEALRLASEHGGEIHLLLTDVIMPGMKGKALAERMAEICPDIRTLFMSGYADSMVARHGLLEPGVSFIEKPFSLVDLARKVREVLDE